MTTKRLAHSIVFALFLAFAGIAHAGPRAITQDIVIKAAGYEWHCRAHLPAQNDPAKKWPLVLVLHGAGGSGDIYLEKCGWAKKADEAGFIVAAPDGLPARPNQTTSFVTNPRLWNSGQLRPLSPRAKIDDIAFFKALLDELERRYNVDKSRIYLTGHSNGAGMTFRLGAEMADRFAAIAPYASQCWVANPKPSRPLPTLFIIGNQDQLVPIDGGKSITPWGSRETPPVADSLAKWAAAIGCFTTPELVSNKAGVKTVIYRSKQHGPDLTANYIEGQGHGWPAGDSMLPERLVGPNSSSFKATDVIWEFFKKQKL